MENVYDSAISFFTDSADVKFKSFSEKIIAGEKPLIGVSVPKIKKYAKSLTENQKREYLKTCKFSYFEDTLLFGIIVASRCADEFFANVGVYLDHVDNWAHIDVFVPMINCVKTDRKRLFIDVKENILSSGGFYLRYRIVSLMVHFLERENLNYIFGVLPKIDGKGYYNDMAIAWLVATAFIKFRKETYEFLKGKKLTAFTQNNAISKICDSFRVGDEDKIMIKTERIK